MPRYCQKSEDNDYADWRWLEGKSISNNQLLQPRYEEENLWIAEQQNVTQDATPLT